MAKVKLPNKVAAQVECAQKNMNTPQTTIASALLNLKAEKIILNEKQIKMVVEAVFNGYESK